MKITIKNVPEHIRDELAAQAARNGQSMQAFLLTELTRLASEPWYDELLGEINKGVRAQGNPAADTATAEAWDAEPT